MNQIQIDNLTRLRDALIAGKYIKINDTYRLREYPVNCCVLGAMMNETDVTPGFEYEPEYESPIPDYYGLDQHQRFQLIDANDQSPEGDWSVVLTVLDSFIERGISDDTRTA